MAFFKGDLMKNYRELLRDVRAHQRRGRWAAAQVAIDAALALQDRRGTAPMIGHGGARRGETVAASAAERFEAAGLCPGDVLEHVKRGVVRATCVYRGSGKFEYSGRVYANLTAAAQAAAADLGLLDPRSGWRFWGLDRTESPTFSAQEREAA